MNIARSTATERLTERPITADLDRVFRVGSKGAVSGSGEIPPEMNTASSPGAHVSGAFRVASPLDLYVSDQIFLFNQGLDCSLLTLHQSYPR